MKTLESLARMCAVELVNNTSMRISELADAQAIVLTYLQLADQRRVEMVVSQTVAEQYGTDQA